MTDHLPATPSNKRPKVGVVREWVLALGVLTAGSLTRSEAEMKLRAYVPLLQDNFPAGAFTQDSLHHVAARCKWFPSYAEVIEHLRDWWREHRPAPPALPPPPPRAPDPDPPTPEQIAQVHALTLEVVAALRVSEMARSAQAFDAAYERRPRPAYLTPAQLDRLSPLPHGRKRDYAAWEAAQRAQAAEPVDPNPAEGVEAGEPIDDLHRQEQ